MCILAAILNFLLHVYSRYPSSSMGENARDMTLATLRAMANGGIHDHVAQVHTVCMHCHACSIDYLMYASRLR